MSHVRIATTTTAAAGSLCTRHVAWKSDEVVCINFGDLGVPSEALASLGKGEVSGLVVVQGRPMTRVVAPDAPWE